MSKSPAIAERTALLWLAGVGNEGQHMKLVRAYLRRTMMFTALSALSAWCLSATAQPYTYHGGAIVRSPKVAVVYWGTQPAGQAFKINQFYSRIFNSPYFDRLGEYGLGTRPQFIGSFDIHQEDSTTVDTIEIARGIDEAILSRILPLPDDDTIYMVHFGPAMTPAMGTNILGILIGPTVGAGFCAYHFSARVQIPLVPPTLYAYGPKIRIGVIPDSSSIAGCTQGSSLDTSTFMASHELVESIADPDSLLVAMRPVVGETLQCNTLVIPPTGEAPNAPWAWTSGKSQICNPDEIADSCSSGQSYRISSTESYFVTKIFMNSAGSCTEAPPMPPPAPPPTPRQICLNQCSAERKQCLSDADSGPARSICVRNYSTCSDACPPAP